ncbi:hypothetical protein IFM89_010925, partial [Coptis chinensis]
MTGRKTRKSDRFWLYIREDLRFATLATRMEQYIQGQSRDLVDQAYTKF